MRQPKLRYRAAYAKAFETGNLAGLTVRCHIDYPTWAECARFVRHLERDKRGSDFLTRDEWLVVDPHVESVWSDGTVRRECH